MTCDTIFSLAASPGFAEDGLCFAARRSGLYHSTDHGETWDLAYRALNLDADLATLAVAVSPAFGADETVFTGVAGGVLRSQNAGKNWQVAPFPPPEPTVSCLAVSPAYRKDGTVLAGTLEDGVFRSGDHGRRWDRWNFGLLDLNVLALGISPAYEDDETVFAGTDSGVFSSTNGGRAWREADFDGGFARVLAIAVSEGFATDGCLFAGTEECGLFRSDDAGGTWSQVGSGVLDGPVNDLVLSPDFPMDGSLLALLSGAVMVSRDGGETWSQWPLKVDSDDVLTCIEAPEGLETGDRLLIGRVEGGVLVA